MNDLNSPDYTTKERAPVDLEFYGPVEGRMARVRRVRHEWETVGESGDDIQGGFRQSIVLNPDEPDQPEQKYQFEQYCEDGRWRIVSDHEDLELVKRAANRWTQEGGEITEFYVD